MLTTAVYWSLLLLPALRPLFGSKPFNDQAGRWGLIITAAYVTAVVGLRHNVGADWNVYLEYYEAAAATSLWSAVQLHDPGYMALNWLAAQVGGGIYMVNLVVAAISVSGVVYLARKQPYPWLALVAAASYLLPVVSTGLSRQSAAIGLVCFALVAIAEKRLARAVILIAVGFLFHKTAMALLPLALLACQKLRVWVVLAGVALASIIVSALIAFAYPHVVDLYINQSEFESSGGLVRVMLTALPGACLLFFHRRLLDPWPGKELWIVCAGVSLVGLLLVNTYSTFIDRSMLYMVPMTMVFYGRFPKLWQSGECRAAVALGVVALQATVLWMWLNYASHRESWIPYAMYPFIAE